MIPLWKFKSSERNVAAFVHSESNHCGGSLRDKEGIGKKGSGMEGEAGELAKVTDWIETGSR
jgi:hypothetical protein